MSRKSLNALINDQPGNKTNARNLLSNKQTNNNDLLEKDGGTKNCLYKD